MAVVVYRGPLERSRLGYLLESASRAYGDVRLIWLVPPKVGLARGGRGIGAGSTRTTQDIAAFERFLQANGKVTDYVLLDGRLQSMPTTLRRLRRLVAARDAPLVCVGFTSLLYGRAVRGPLGRVVWCPNGIPEERLLHRDGPRDRAYVRAQWRATVTGAMPALIVTVSHRMSELIQARWPSAPCFAAPNCVRAEVFRPSPGHARNRVTYLGTGAPWQGLSYTSEVWGQLARLLPDVRFRVISRDERTRILADRVPGSSIEFSSAEEPADVARLLWGARLGFLVRSEHVVNRVSYPTKFGEYVAAGVPVVATDVGWDLTALVHDTGCGRLVPPDASPVETARAAARAYEEDLAPGCDAAARALDRDLWVDRLAARFPT
ncbi:MAG TPA: glycosyltransferase [Nitriliruptorales bacterium]|nr:glycosyltransferase [Nitriliruptorales bacterium]